MKWIRISAGRDCTLSWGICHICKAPQVCLTSCSKFGNYCSLPPWLLLKQSRHPEEGVNSVCAEAPWSLIPCLHSLGGLFYWLPGTLGDLLSCSQRECLLLWPCASEWLTAPAPHCGFVDLDRVAGYLFPMKRMLISKNNNPYVFIFVNMKNPNFTL